MRRADTTALRALAVVLGLGLLSLGAWAQGAPVPTPQGPSLPLMVGQGAGANSYSVPIQTLLFFTALSFLPAVLLLMTGFTRIVIVLSLLRQALGTQSAPPNQVIVGLNKFSVEEELPVTFGVLTVENAEQAEARAGGPHGNKGAEAMEAALRLMAAIREF